MRDLFVFLLLFLLGLVVLTTGLFPVATVQAVPPVEPEIEQRIAVVDRPPERSRAASVEQPTPQEDMLASPEPTSTPEQNSNPNFTPQASSGRASKGVSGDRVQNEQVIQRIKIPSLQVDAKVVDVPFDGVTWDISTLGQDIARLGEVPGENSGENIVLAGHFSIGWTELGPFRYISRLAIGAPLLVYTDSLIYTYEVREHAVVGDQDERVIAYSSEPQLTLLTCETWDEETRKFLRRRVVFAELVRIEPLGYPTIQ